jgi:murein DD-endopeptidase MepM/ murein hydrolase activator NlpD
VSKVGRILFTKTFALAVVVAALTPMPAVAAGGSSYAPSSEYPSSLLPQGSGQASPSGGSNSSGGAGYSTGLKQRVKQRTARRKRQNRPVLASFDVSRSAVFAYGRPATITYQINDRSRYVRVRLAFVQEGQRGTLARFNLGRKRTGVPHTFRWRGTDGRDQVPQGSYHFRITATNPAGQRLVRSSQAVGGTPLDLRDHRFPVDGAHGFGGPGARFGAPRPGHIHQGQDITAAEGTPIVAPRAGLITWRAYQAGGAGYYLVLAGQDEPYNYVFMHLQRGSLLVSQGDIVTTGQMLARVGSTGESTGPHLHFEIWDGPWANGGHPVDPMPFLKAWDTSP